METQNPRKKINRYYFEGSQAGQLINNIIFKITKKKKHVQIEIREINMKNYKPKLQSE